MPASDALVPDRRSAITPMAALLLTCSLVAALLSIVAAPARAAVTIRVPEEYATISAAIAAASPGDVIDIAAGTYTGQITLNKAVTLKGRQGDPADPSDNTTILRVADPALDVIVVPSNVSPAPTVTGVVLRDGLSGISFKSPMRIEGNTFINNNDQLDFKIGAGGTIRGNLLQAALDDGIDINHPVADFSIIDNTIVDSRGDGVEMRLNDDSFTPTADILFRGNEISGSRSDGIQIIDYFTDTNRVIAIERNLIHDNGRAGVGLLDGGTTVEDFRAASILERITVINNTLVRNDHGVSGGDNLFALNNIFVGHVLALKNVDGGSVASHNLFWQNTTNQSGSNVDNSIVADPLLDNRFELGTGSPAIDAGLAHFERSGEVIWDDTTFTGAAPDLGWRETDAPTGGGQPPTISSATITPSGPGTNALLTANATATDPDGDAVTFSYQWKKNGSNLSGATGKTLNLAVAGNGDKGDEISVTVTASDGSNASAPVTASSVTVVNTNPTFVSNLGNRSSAEGDAVSVSAAATDADGDTLTYGATGLPPGVSIDTATGLISGTISAGAASGSPYAVQVTVGDTATVDATDTFSWTVTTQPASGIVFHAASGIAYPARAAVPIVRPAGIVTGDVLTASILVVGPATVTPPPGWTLLRTDTNGDVRQLLYVRVAGASERATYRFALSVASKAAGTLAAYGGVDAAATIASAGQPNASSTSITAPSIAAQRAGDLVVGFFGIVPDVATQITPANGMTERIEVITAKAQPRVALELADAALAAAGATGVRVATSSIAGPNIGQVVVLRAK